jgi:hypothetical protein
MAIALDGHLRLTVPSPASTSTLPLRLQRPFVVLMVPLTMCGGLSICGSVAAFTVYGVGRGLAAIRRAASET